MPMNRIGLFGQLDQIPGTIKGQGGKSAGRNKRLSLEVRKLIGRLPAARGRRESRPPILMASFDPPGGTVPVVAVARFCDSGTTTGVIFLCHPPSDGEGVGLAEGDQREKGKDRHASSKHRHRAFLRTYFLLQIKSLPELLFD